MLLFANRNTFSAQYHQSNFKRKISLAVEKKLIPLADIIIAVSNGVAKDLNKIFPKSSSIIHTIYNPTVTPEITQKAKSPVMLPPWSHKENSSPIILSMGRLQLAKNHFMLLKAFSIILKNRDAYLVIIGEGPERKKLETFSEKLGVKKNVYFYGFQLNPFKFMSKSQVFALSSNFEGLPNVLIEAMACGTPVVSTDCPSGPKEILEDGKHGHLVPVNDHFSMAKAILYSLENPIDKNQLIDRAHTFSLETSVKKYIDVIEQIGTSY